MSRKTITETAKDALKTVNEVASSAALKGVEGGEAVANAAKSTLAGSSSSLSGTADQLKGSAKKLKGEAESKVEEIKQKS